MSPRILLTGGTGYIGSHTIIELIEKNFNLVVIDNYINSSKKIIKKLGEIIDISKVKFIEADILDLNFFNIIEGEIDIVIHFVALKSVTESIEKPLLYYQNNIQGLLNVIKFCKKKKINNLIFSSSATVYGSALSPLYETDTIGIGISNPYGYTKYISEIIIKDYCNAHKNFNVISLRYFNPVGNHHSGLIGDDPINIPNNLMPILNKVVIKNNFIKKNLMLDDKYNFFNIFGYNYDTKDGTAERDFIHVVDLAKAHVKSCEKIGKLKSNFEVFNIGTGRPVTVLEFINKYTEINKVNIPYKKKKNREGDLPSVYCNCDKALNELNWKCEKNTIDICKDSLNFIKKNYCN